MAAIQMTIKNTFFEVADQVEITIPTKRSSSLPRCWKPACTLACKLEVEDTIPSDASTGDSDEDHEALNGAFSSSTSDCNSSEHADDDQAKAMLCLDVLCCIGSKATPAENRIRWCDSDDLDDLDEENKPKTKHSLCLSDVITAEKTKLRAKARLFESVMAVPTLGTDLLLVLMAARASLCGNPKVKDVCMTQGTFGGTTTIGASYVTGSLEAWEMVQILAAVKIALLDAASNSTNTYMIGYESQPFSNVGSTGFSGVMGSVSAMQEDTICWDFYQKGFCSRFANATCCWCHPTDADLMKIDVMLIETPQ